MKSANADAFINAYSSVLVTSDEDKSADYVAAAKKLRPDLSKQIDAAAVEVESAPEDTDNADRHRVSRHRHRVAVCCRYHAAYQTVYIPRKGVQHFLSSHPQCRQGNCARQHHGA